MRRVMNDATSHIIRGFTLSLVVLAGDVIVACNPCETHRFGITEDIVAATNVCPSDGDGSTGDSESTGMEGASETTAPTAGEPSSSSGGPDTCTATPGVEWGPCFDGSCEDATAPSACVGGPGGETICLPECAGACPPFDDVVCEGDTTMCVPGSLCVVQCVDGGCHTPGMKCITTGGLTTCAWAP